MELWSRILLLTTPFVLVSQGAWSMSISDAKLLPDGQAVNLVQKVVTYSASGYFYVEGDARNIGIMVEKADHALAVGMRADVVGTVQTKTTTNKERFIAASSALQSAPPANQGVHGPSPCGGPKGEVMK